MKTLTVLVLLFGGISATVNNRIVGGTDARDRQFPYQVSLRNQSFGHFCGGAIVKSNWIVTAARCLFRASPTTTYVVVGTILLTPSGTTFPVARFVLHQQYEDSTLKNNIGLVRTRDRLLNAPSTGLVPLNIDFSLPGHVGVLSGWGKLTASSATYPVNLRSANLTVISLDECKAAYPQYVIDSTVICALGKGFGGCDGDNGNPFVYNNMLIGIMSWGIPCATGKPDVFVNASAYGCWIITNAVD